MPQCYFFSSSVLSTIVGKRSISNINDFLNLKVANRPNFAMPENIRLNIKGQIAPRTSAANTACQPYNAFGSGFSGIPFIKTPTVTRMQKIIITGNEPKKSNLNMLSYEIPDIFIFSFILIPSAIITLSHFLRHKPIVS